MAIPWNEIEDACPENGELARVLRGLEGIHGGGPQVDWWQSRERCAEVLNLFRTSHAPSAKLAAALEGADFEPQITAGNPERSAIRDGMARFGFKRVSEDAFLQESTGILLTDAAPRNVRIVDAAPVPFDAIAMFATEPVLDWAESRRSH